MDQCEGEGITPLHFFELQNTVFVAIFEQIWWSSSKKKVHMKKARLQKKIPRCLLLNEDVQNFRLALLHLLP